MDNMTAYSEHLMSTASHIKQISRNSVSIKDFTQCNRKAILYSKYNDIGHISKIFNSLVRQIKTLRCVNCKNKETHFSVEFEVVFNILIFLCISYFFKYPLFCIWVQLWQTWSLVLCIHSFYMYTQRKNWWILYYEIHIYCVQGCISIQNQFCSF
jgi:hypothetical protein